MSSAHLFVEAVDTAVILTRAVIGWVIFLATFAAILVLAAIATGATAARAVVRAVRAGRGRGRGPAPASDPRSLTAVIPDPDTPTQPHTPAWARKDAA